MFDCVQSIMLPSYETKIKSSNNNNFCEIDVVRREGKKSTSWTRACVDTETPLLQYAVDKGETSMDMGGKASFKLRQKKRDFLVSEISLDGKWTAHYCSPTHLTHGAAVPRKKGGMKSRSFTYS